MSDYVTSTANCRDSGVEIEFGIKLHKELLEPFERAAAGDSATKHSSDDINYSTISLKHVPCDTDVGWTSNAETATEKRKHDTETAITLRVLCPFYKLDPEAHTRKISCFHQGFPTIAKLKQNLIKEHNISKLKLVFIKSNGFKQLGSIEAKWRQVFLNLCPDVSENDVPSPCKYSSPTRAWEHYDKSVQTMSSVYILTDNTWSCNSACKNCFSQNVFRTKGTGSQVDVCGDCHSTDILYQTVVVPFEDRVQSVHNDVTSTEVPNHSQGLGEDMTWMDDFAGQSAVERGGLREDIDELFEF